MRIAISGSISSLCLSMIFSQKDRFPLFRIMLQKRRQSLAWANSGRRGPLAAACGWRNHVS
jgi:hypothetical protein